MFDSVPPSRGAAPRALLAILALAGIAAIGTGWLLRSGSASQEPASGAPPPLAGDAPPQPDHLLERPGGPAGTGIEPAPDTSLRAPARVSAEAGGVTVQGVVRARDSGEPLSGFSLRLRRGEATDLTGSDGRFTLRLDTPRNGTVLAEAPAPWRMVESRQRFRSSELAASKEIEFLAWRTPGGRLPVILRDQGTGEPVPRFGLEVVQNGAVVARLESDEAGALTLPDPGDGGLTQLRLFDVEGTSGWSRLIPLPHTVAPAGGGEGEVAIPIGPTYRLAVELPEEYGPEDFMLSLSSYGSHTVVGFRGGAPVRMHGEPWVRFGPTRLSSPGPWQLTMQDAGGTLVARAAVDSITGVYPKTVALEFLAASSVQGFVRDPEEAPVAGQQLVMHHYDGAAYDRRGYWAKTDAQGRYAFLGLEPGSYALRLQLEAGVRGITHSFTLAAGERLEDDFVRAWPNPAGTIRGAVRSRSGTYHRSLQLTMMTDEITKHGEGYSLQTAVEWTEVDGNHEGSFVFDEVPPGVYIMRLWAPEDEDWEPRTFRVSPPQTGITFLLRDAQNSVPVTARVTDSATGEELASFLYWVEYRVPGTHGYGRQGGPVSSGSRFAHLASGVKTMRWIVGAPGYEPAHGDGTAFSPPLEPGQPWTLEVRLRPGWGMEIETVEDTPSEPPVPLAGVEVALDGRAVGTTNGDGRLWLSADDEPQQILLRREGWGIKTGVLDPESGQLRRFVLHGVVVLERR